MPAKPKRILFLLGLACAPLVDSAYAAIDPAVNQVESLDSALLKSMKAGSALSVTDRYHKLAPVIEQTFDLLAMTGFAVGPGWTSFSADQQQATVAAFTRLTIASYAHNFREFDGQRFDVEANFATRGVDKIVQTHIISPHDTPVSLIYRMRESGGTWKIIDIYYGAISQLTTRRSDFAGPIASGGVQGLIAHLNSLSDDLLK